MTSQSVRRTTLLALIATVCGTTSAHLAFGGKPKPPPPAAVYAITDLGGFSGSTGGAALAINNLNQVVGYCIEPHKSNAYYRAFVWDPVAGVTALGDLGGNYALALDINDRGQVVGLGLLPKSNSVSHAFLWESGKLSDLNTLAAIDSTRTLQRADGINNDGRIVGTMILNANGEYRSFLLTPTK